jgi:hypothetical protein
MYSVGTGYAPEQVQIAATAGQKCRVKHMTEGVDCRFRGPNRIAPPTFCMDSAYSRKGGD